MGFRIELVEKYAETATEDDALERLGLSIERKYSTRRVNIHFDDIERVVEIPGSSFECKVRLYGGEELLIKENYDDMSQFVTSLENFNDEDDEE